MSLYSEPPALREFKYDKPTLLVCWWATALCTCIICLRVIGRFIRTERLFPEDRIAALALIPLFLRMGCVHYILLHGTNNSDFEGVELTDAEIRHKEIASGLVLLSRILYAATYVACPYLQFLFYFSFAFPLHVSNGPYLAQWRNGFLLPNSLWLCC
jgi:hypothetical protein